MFRMSNCDAQRFYFNHYTVDEGLSNNSILCSAQDQDGFLWFGTKDGLNRFDGYNFRQFYSDTDNDNGLGSNFIHTLKVDRNKNIWVGTDQGIYIFDPYLERFSTFKGATKGEILQIDEDDLGNIWFISNNRLYSFHPINGQLERGTEKGFKAVITAFRIDTDNNIWIAANGTLRNLTTGLSFTLPSTGSDPHKIEKIFIDDLGILWVGTSKDGVFTINPSTGKIQHVVPPNKGSSLFVRDIYQTDQSTFFIGTESGLIVYDRNNSSYRLLQHEGDHPWSISDNAIYTVCKDHQGGLWVGTYFGGVNYYHPQHNVFQKIFPRFSTSSIQGHAVREIVEDRHQNLWIGTEDNGLYAWNQTNGQFRSFTLKENLSHTNIHGLALVGDSLLVGTFYGGLDIIDTRTKKLIRHIDSQTSKGGLTNNFVFYIYRTKKGRVLLATARGLCEFYPGKDSISLVKEAPGYIFYTSIFEDRKENLWLSTWRDGLYHIDYSTGHTKVHLHQKDDTSSLNSNRVNRVFQDSYGSLWIATESGLAQWTAEGKPMRRFSKKDGLPSNLILALQEDQQHNLWISTTRGLARMNLKDFRIHVFDKESGLLDLQFNYNSTFKDNRGYFYFGSSTGLIRFHPDSMFQFTYPQQSNPLYITKIQSLQRALQVGSLPNNIDTAVTYLKKLELNYDESTISIDFAALNFVSSQATSYRYILEGFDKEWTLLRNSHTAHFTKIPPGNYTFKIQAVDANGQPISNERSLEISIRPPFWASTTALILYVVLGCFTIYILVVSYDRKIKEKNRRRLEAIKAHRERELFKTKMDFFARVAHDIKTPLTLIKAPLERLRAQDTKDAKTDRLLNTMHQNTEKLVNLTNQLLDFRKIESSEHNLHIEQQSVNQLITGRLLEFQPLFNQKGIEFTYHCNEAIEAYLDLEVLSKIVDNLLTNAVKYAEKTIVVELKTAEEEKEFFTFTIKNDGPVLSNQELRAIFKPFHRASEHYHIEGSGLGLALAHSFAELHGGSLFFLENSENLNIFVLKIPIRGTYG
ncbi:ligand-binding sensor domain-containing protein [Sphingobacterium sp. LRF_L2]|uniref:ligand-binding sensor domain-containing protein n=1 Tax=Sphingobacterium sp. LRF_L2 TaxID=3369421 RepID=UPI003F6432B6